MKRPLLMKERRETETEIEIKSFLFLFQIYKKERQYTEQRK